MLYNNFSHELTLFQKIKNYDFILLFCILILGITSIFTMYSTDGGEVLFHTKSHFIKFSIFFPMMIVLSFINIKYWHAGSYIFYVLILGLLVWVALYGVTASGSRRWINLYFLNLQPSELMKIAVILCLAKFFHRIRTTSANSFTSILVSLTIIFLDLTGSKQGIKNEAPFSNPFQLIRYWTFSTVNICFLLRQTTYINKVRVCSVQHHASHSSAGDSCASRQAVVLRFYAQTRL